MLLLRAPRCRQEKRPRCPIAHNRRFFANATRLRRLLPPCCWAVRLFCATLPRPRVSAPCAGVCWLFGVWLVLALVRGLGSVGEWLGVRRSVLAGACGAGRGPRF